MIQETNMRRTFRLGGTTLRSSLQMVLGIAAISCLLTSIPFAVARQATPISENFAATSIDLGLVVSDVDKTVAFYTNVLGFKELPGFSGDAEFLTKVGLTDNQSISVRVLALGGGPNATKLKVMSFSQVPVSRVDQTYIHSAYGVRYLTVLVKDLNLAIEHAATAGGKPIAQSPQPLPANLAPGIGLANYRDPDGNIVELVGPWK
jgi:lactoylglutathione lyase